MDQEQFKLKVLPLREKLFFIAAKMIEEEYQAEDVTQEVFLKLWNTRNTLNRYRSVEALAVTVTKNTCIDYLRIKEREKLSAGTDLLIHAVADNPYLHLERKNTEEILEKIIDNLPSLQRSIIKMKDIEGMEVDEIAVITGAQPEAIRMNLSRARKKVREEYLKLSR